MATDIEKAPEALQELVAQADTGGRKPTGWTAKVIFAVALAWALFQTWYASPLPFTFGFGILNDTEARAVHLAFALFLAFVAWPASKRSPRDHVPLLDWVFAFVGAFAGAYLLLFYAALATRPGQPTTMDIATALVGMVLLLEATRRSVVSHMCDISRFSDAPLCASTSGSMGPAIAYTRNSSASAAIGQPTDRRVASSSSTMPTSEVAMSIVVGWPGRVAIAA